MSSDTGYQSETTHGRTSSKHDVLEGDRATATMLRPDPYAFDAEDPPASSDDGDDSGPHQLILLRVEQLPIQYVGLDAISHLAVCEDKAYIDKLRAIALSLPPNERVSFLSELHFMISQPRNLFRNELPPGSWAAYGFAVSCFAVATLVSRF